MPEGAVRSNSGRIIGEENLENRTPNTGTGEIYRAREEFRK
jgi:hypothetical protein